MSLGQLLHGGQGSLSRRVGLPDDGVALFGLITGAPAEPTFFLGTDSAPDSAAFVLPGGPTTFIPEPTTALLLATGLAGLAVWRHWPS